MLSHRLPATTYPPPQVGELSRLALCLFWQMPAVARHRDDVDDAAWAAKLLEPAHDFLRQYEWRADIDRKQAVPQLDGRIFDVAAVGKAGRVDEPIDVAEALLGACNDVAAHRSVAQIPRDENGCAACF